MDRVKYKKTHVKIQSQFIYPDADLNNTFDFLE